jgi:hypothetical protein
MCSAPVSIDAISTSPIAGMLPFSFHHLLRDIVSFVRER